MFDFKPLSEDDIERLHGWLNAPHAVRWFGGARTIEDVAEEYLDYINGKVPIYPYFVRHDKKPIGMLSWERFGDFPELQELYEVDDPNVVNCDMLIGEPEALHRGWGATILRQFLDQIVFASGRFTTCIIDPVPDNAIAIRMYEKAGFRFIRALPECGEGNPLYLMELTREQLQQPVPPNPEVYIRLARKTELATAIEIDNDACARYTEYGLPLDLEDDHPFAQKERARWADALRKGRMLMACTKDNQAIGFVVFDIVDERPFIEQISVRCAWMNRGVGTMLVERAKRWSVREGDLWLTTYDKVPWNRPWYERRGFAVANDAEHGPELEAILAAERAALPASDRRVAMVFRHETSRHRP